MTNRQQSKNKRKENVDSELLLPCYAHHIAVGGQDSTIHISGKRRKGGKEPTYFKNPKTHPKAGVHYYG